MRIFDRYLFKNLFFATVFIAVTLSAVLLLTQSLKFLELVMDSGASSFTFWILTFLALPRSFEVIMPIALMASTIFIYNKMIMDSELVVMRAVGMSPMVLARPALYMAAVVTMFLLLVTMWLAPLSLSNMKEMRKVIKEQYSSLLFREGVFNSVASDLTVFVNGKASDGELRGLVIHDGRPKENLYPVTVMAKRGVLVSTEDGQQVVVFEGSRQDMNDKTGVLNRLDFERYIIDLPDGAGPVRQRWPEPDERTFWELLHPDMGNQRDVENRRDFMLEIHRRIVSPLLAPAFTLLALSCLLLGPVDRRGQGQRIALAVAGVVLIQGLYLGAFNLSKNSDWGLVFMYALVFVPLGGGLFLLSTMSETLQRQVLFGKRKKMS